MRDHTRLLAATAGLAATSFVTLLVSGVWLSTSYRPGPWRDLGNGFFATQLGGGWVHAVHVGAAIVLSAALALLAGLVLSAAARTWRNEEGLVGASAVCMVALVVAFSTGKDLRWDQLALWAVTIDSDHRGIWSNAFDDQVRFFLVPGIGEVIPDVYRTQAVAHLVAAPAIVVVAVAIGAILARR